MKMKYLLPDITKEQAKRGFIILFSILISSLIAVNLPI